MECFRLGKIGYTRQDCRVKLEHANCASTITPGARKPQWMRMVKINSRPVITLLDTGCTKSMVQHKCVNESEYLGWKIPHKMVSATRIWFPAAIVALQIDG